MLVYFTDPILRAPTLGSIFMCLAAALVGVMIYLRKQSLIGEALSHAAYPGVMIGVIAAGLYRCAFEGFELSFFILIGAFLSSVLGLFIIQIMERKFKTPSDSALCFVLSTLFGIGITLASYVQFNFTNFYKQAQIYLYGQTATMTDIHIVLYALFASFIIFILFLFKKELQVITFDRNYAKSLGISTKSIDILLLFLVALAVIIGIRSVGVVLMSGMLIAPAVAARQYTNRFSTLLFIAGLIGMVSGFLGNVFSFEFSEYLLQAYPGIRYSLPTGPMIILVASFICIFSLLFAPERGMLSKLFRIMKFRYTCTCENILKTIWRADEPATLDQIAQYQSVSKFYLKYIMWRLSRNGWVFKTSKNHYKLTHDGFQRASQIVRLHRLWEVYLADYLGVGAERVHRNAEEMEHILTPQLERELTYLLNDPKRDPHHQPIPPRELL